MLTLLRRLGPTWGVILTDAGFGNAANDERLAYVFDRDHVRPSGLAGELVIDAATFGTQAVPLRAQFARPPFMVSFETGPANAPVGFTLISLHVDYGRTPAERTPEIQTFATWLNRFRPFAGPIAAHRRVLRASFVAIDAAHRRLRASPDSCPRRSAWPHPALRLLAVSARRSRAPAASATPIRTGASR